jgi:hypothetical protein
MNLLLALLAAAAQPAAAGAQAPAVAAPPASTADTDAAFALFESICLSGGEPPAGFETAAWTDFPPAVRLLNTYGYSGTFFRRADPETWVARTRTESAMGIETKCGIAARGIETETVIERLKKRAKAQAPTRIGGGAMTLIVGQGGIFDVTGAEDGWVIVRTSEILVRADLVPRRYRKRKGKRD